MMYIHLLYTVEYHVSEFHDETYTVLAPNTRNNISASIPLNVNLDSKLFHLSYAPGDIVARLEIQSATFPQSEVLLMHPDGSLGFTLEIMLSSSLEFTYCHDQLRNINHTVYNVPIVVSPSDDDIAHVFVDHQYNISLIPTIHQTIIF